MECSCGKIAFGSQTCADIGGRTNHTGGKALLSMDTDGDGDKDLVLTEESCSSLYRMENLGTTDVPVLGNVSLFPIDNPISILSYPAPYLEDVDQDGISDLIISPNLNSREDILNDFESSLWLYKNTGSNLAPVFTLLKGDFLQDEMIEVGDFSAPTFADLDLDGDLDLLVGTYIDAQSVRGSLTCYENIGTPTAPRFKWITDDFANLSFTSLYNIRPQLIDIDMNGGVDLAFTATGGGLTSLYYMQSKSASAPSFAGQPLERMDLSIGLNANATLVDVDRDGHLDVLVGTSTGALNYFCNTGVGNTFSLANDTYLGLGASPSRQYISVAVGDLDGDGREDLVAGDYEGSLSIFSDFRSAEANPVEEKQLIYDGYSNQYVARDFGGSIRPAVANVLGVNRPSLALGNRQGGLHLLRHDNTQPLSETPKISLSPNPVASGGALTILADRSVILEIYTALGARIGLSQTIPGDQLTNFPIQGLASGLYVARFTSGSKSVGLRFVVR